VSRIIRIDDDLSATFYVTDAIDNVSSRHVICVAMLAYADMIERLLLEVLAQEKVTPCDPAHSSY